MPLLLSNICPLNWFLRHNFPGHPQSFILLLSSSSCSVSAHQINVLFLTAKKLSPIPPTISHPQTLPLAARPATAKGNCKQQKEKGAGSCTLAAAFISQKYQEQILFCTGQQLVKNSRIEASWDVALGRVEVITCPHTFSAALPHLPLLPLPHCWAQRNTGIPPPRPEQRRKTYQLLTSPLHLLCMCFIELRTRQRSQ